MMLERDGAGNLHGVEKPSSYVRGRVDCPNSRHTLEIQHMFTNLCFRLLRAMNSKAAFST